MQQIQHAGGLTLQLQTRLTMPCRSVGNMVACFITSDNLLKQMLGRCSTKVAMLSLLHDLMSASTACMSAMSAVRPLITLRGRCSAHPKA